MHDFYCHDMYWCVSMDNLATGIFLQEAAAREHYERECARYPDDEVILWRLNGGYLCTPAVAIRKSLEDR